MTFPKSQGEVKPEEFLTMDNNADAASLSHATAGGCATVPSSVIQGHMFYGKSAHKLLHFITQRCLYIPDCNVLFLEYSSKKIIPALPFQALLYACAKKIMKLTFS